MDKELYKFHGESLQSDEGKETNILLAIMLLVSGLGAVSVAVDALRKPAPFLPFSYSCECTFHGNVLMLQHVKLMVVQGSP